MIGRIHSIQTLGAVDGPGLRFVLFLQGCPLRCAYCHNPDSWDLTGGTEMDVNEIFEKVKRYRTYFGETGGITVSGGEPLLQAEFVTALFTMCREAGIHTTLDTSGCLPEHAGTVLDVTDLCLLDIKMTNARDYMHYTRCELSKVLEFLDMLEDRRIPVWIRQVIVKGINDTKENTLTLHRLLKERKYIEKVEFLPFRKLCVPKYHNLGIPFPLELTPETTLKKIQILTDYYDSLS